MYQNHEARGKGISRGNLFPLKLGIDKAYFMCFIVCYIDIRIGKGSDIDRDKV